VQIQLDLTNCFNVLSSRGVLSTYDVLSPQHGQLLHALSLATDGERALRSHGK
jgi:hypothetical protein